ncbi:hypothetical protein GEA64_17280 [Photorhabdus khanii]|uniref:Uncharacterized protein n=1 Tax=Photorhabdus khanii TaxID=1004150 RepID=A0A7C9GKR9_9GAMM|nr:hypothetical protein [Photorhabdus khanii]MQL49596.1 hypothetical protein [Photorhabdus khanii]
MAVLTVTFNKEEITQNYLQVLYKGGVWPEKHNWDEFPYDIAAAREALNLKIKNQCIGSIVYKNRIGSWNDFFSIPASHCNI